MKKLIITIFSLLLTVNIVAQQVDYTKPDSLRVVALMKKAKTLKDKSMASYMLFFGRELRGVPYVAKTLEKNSQEKLGQSPAARLHHVCRDGACPVEKYG